MNKRQNNEMLEQKLDTPITLMTKMLMQMKAPNQGKPTKNEGYSRHTP